MADTTTTYGATIGARVTDPTHQSKEGLCKEDGRGGNGTIRQCAPRSVTSLRRCERKRNKKPTTAEIIRNTVQTIGHSNVQ